MNQAQRQFQAMNNRTTANIQVPPSSLLMIIIGEMLWAGVICFLVAVHIMSALFAFILIVAGLMVPVVRAHLKNKAAKIQQ